MPEEINKAILDKTSENGEVLDDIKDIGIETVAQIEKVEKAIKAIKVSTPVDTETHKLLSNLLDEMKKQCEISIDLNLI